MIAPDVSREGVDYINWWTLERSSLIFSLIEIVRKTFIRNTFSRQEVSQALEVFEKELTSAAFSGKKVHYNKNRRTKQSSHSNNWSMLFKVNSKDEFVFSHFLLKIHLNHYTFCRLFCCKIIIFCGFFWDFTLLVTKDILCKNEMNSRPCIAIFLDVWL